MEIYTLDQFEINLASRVLEEIGVAVEHGHTCNELIGCMNGVMFGVFIGLRNNMILPRA